ncbi:JmjC domain-containing protein [Marinomonas sp. 2405UD68-3]|uniref:JmjC domain-containing protein n=1 Tax=Marinomonas sp. 2405UD68-3 TaxID=3391835 RepID=UPI0039C9B174
MSTLDSPISILGGMTIRTFMEEYWQKKPLVIRGGLKDFPLPLEADELAGLSMEEEVESRIVIEKGNTPWELQQGPFTDETFANLPEEEWTLLVQAVDHWVPEIQELKERFHFLPSWRLDDIMVSYATKGGSVGPHFDQYDVFLIQMSGGRRWQVLPPDQYTDIPIKDIDLHILSEFTPNPELEYDLHTGDILYLPPNYAHNGRALDNECMTYSVGFRAPSIQDALTGIHDQLIEQADEKKRFAAPGLFKEIHHAEIDSSDLSYLHSELSKLLDQPEKLLDWLGQNMSDVKYPEYQKILTTEETEQAFSQIQKGATFFRPGDARICYATSTENSRQIKLFCNGDHLVVDHTLESFIQAICDQVEFEFTELDFDKHSDIALILKFLLQTQGLIELTENEE